MSLLYSRTRLWWDGRHGQAQHDGVEFVLTHWPVGLPEVVQLDYCPEQCRPEIMLLGCPKREMEAPEIAAVKAWLERFADVMKRRLARSRP